MTEPIYTIATHEFHPDYWAVYTIHHPVLGFFCGFKPMGIRVPMWCDGFGGAKKFDAFRDGVDARERALGLVEYLHTEMDGAEVRCYRRCHVYPEQYAKAAGEEVGNGND